MAEKKVTYNTKKGSRDTPGRPCRSSIKKRKIMNRYELEQETKSVSASANKLKSSSKKYDIEVSPIFEYRFIDFVTVFTTLSQILVCKQCGTNVTFKDTSKRGLGYKIMMKCDKCDPTVINAVPLIEKNAYDINRRIVFAMRLLGVGLHGLTKFCAFMDLPHPIFHSFYDTIIKNISTATAVVCKKSLKNAAAEEQKISEENGYHNGLTVSGDGSWRKRGFSSLFGIATLIGWFTGKVVDIIVKSKYCKMCEYWEKKADTCEFEEWATKHKDECEANHEGSAGKMEVNAVIEMFRRSEDLHGVKYSNYIGDGDSKTFKGILDCEPYDDVIVKKKECIGHVQKRMGTRLRNLKKNTKGLGGKGKLSAKLIDELAIYYGLAIRRNVNSVENMKKEIWATLYHKISTDDKPQHDFCPVGDTSWCTYQKAKASNKLAEYKHKTPMNSIVFKAVKPVYQELSSDELLTRCLGGFSQNNNESFNATVWAIAPKTYASGKKIIDIATNIAVCNFNDGYHSIMEIMQVLNLRVGTNCYNFCQEGDARRIIAAERSLTDAAKEARKSLLAAKKEAEEDNLMAEGQFYGAGIAD